MLNQELSSPTKSSENVEEIYNSKSLFKLFKLNNKLQFSSTQQNIEQITDKLSDDDNVNGINQNSQNNSAVQNVYRQNKQLYLQTLIQQRIFPNIYRFINIEKGTLRIQFENLQLLSHLNNVFQKKEYKFGEDQQISSQDLEFLNDEQIILEQLMLLKRNFEYLKDESIFNDEDDNQIQRILNYLIEVQSNNSVLEEILQITVQFKYHIQKLKESKQSQDISQEFLTIQEFQKFIKSKIQLLLAQKLIESGKYVPSFLNGLKVDSTDKIIKEISFRQSENILNFLLQQNELKDVIKKLKFEEFNEMETWKDLKEYYQNILNPIIKNTKDNSGLELFTILLKQFNNNFSQYQEELEIIGESNRFKKQVELCQSQLGNNQQKGDIHKFCYLVCELNKKLYLKNEDPSQLQIESQIIENQIKLHCIVKYYLWLQNKQSKPYPLIFLGLGVKDFELRINLSFNLLKGLLEDHNFINFVQKKFKANLLVGDMTSFIEIIQGLCLKQLSTQSLKWSDLLIKQGLIILEQKKSITPEIVKLCKNEEFRNSVANMQRNLSKFDDESQLTNTLENP